LHRRSQSLQARAVQARHAHPDLPSRPPGRAAPRLHPDPALEPAPGDPRPARLRPGLGRPLRRADPPSRDRPVSGPAPDRAGRGLKVVLFGGGRGIRLREHSETLPKPMVPIGYRPILWHVMRYYAHFGQRDFVLCLGYKADVIKDYFLRYNEALSNDFVLDGRADGRADGRTDGRTGAVTLLQSD